MNPDQIELIQNSWKKILPTAITSADRFYKKLSEVDPAIREIFPEDLTDQKRAFRATLGRVLKSLDELEGTAPTDRELGDWHIAYGADPGHYQVECETLVWTLEQGIGDNWNDDLKEAWGNAYDNLSLEMVEAQNARTEAAENAEANAKAEQEEADRKAKEEAAEAEAEEEAKAEEEEAERVSKEEAEIAAKAESEAAAELAAAAEKKAKKKARRDVGSIADSLTAKQKNTLAEQASGPHRQLVVFDLDTEQYGLDIGAVREIIRLQEITAVPRAPEFVEGVINLRGKIIPVIDLRIKFELEQAERDEDFRIVVVDVNGNEIGMIVDAVTEVSRVPEMGIQPPSKVVAGQDSEYLTGIANTGDRMIILLDIGKLISVEQVASTTAAGEAAATDGDSEPTESGQPSGESESEAPAA